MRIGKELFRAPAVGYGWARLLPLVLVIGWISLLHIPQMQPSMGDWAFGLVSALLVLGGGRWPLAVTLIQCGLLVVAAPLAWPFGRGIVEVLASVALGELAFRRRGWPLWVGVAAVAAANAWDPVPVYSLAGNALVVLGNVGFPLLLGSFLRSIRELARQSEQRAVEAERRRESEILAARATERAAIARELHDVVAHHVAAIVLRAGVVRHVVPAADPRLAEALDDVHRIGVQALADLRGMVSVLRDPDRIDESSLLSGADLTSALTAVLDRTRATGIEVDATVDVPPLAELDAMRRHAVLRVVQEGLTNVLKHAGPDTRARVAVRRNPDGRLRIEISDDGGSGRRRSAPNGSGNGLVVMRERVELLGGSFRAERAGAGWSVRATLPSSVEHLEVTG